MEVRKILPNRWVAAGYTMSKRGSRWEVLDTEYATVAKTETLHDALNWVGSVAFAA